MTSLITLYYFPLNSRTCLYETRHNPEQQLYNIIKYTIYLPIIRNLCLENIYLYYIELNGMYWHIMVHTASKHNFIIITISGHWSNDKITSTAVIISIFDGLPQDIIFLI